MNGAPSVTSAATSNVAKKTMAARINNFIAPSQWQRASAARCITRVWGVKKCCRVSGLRDVWSVGAYKPNVGNFLRPMLSLRWQNECSQGTHADTKARVALERKKKEPGRHTRLELTTWN